MIYKSDVTENDAIMRVSEFMAVAARTAIKFVSESVYRQRGKTFFLTAAPWAYNP